MSSYLWTDWKAFIGIKSIFQHWLLNCEKECCKGNTEGNELAHYQQDNYTKSPLYVVYGDNIYNFCEETLFHLLFGSH